MSDKPTTPEQWKDAGITEDILDGVGKGEDIAVKYAAESLPGEPLVLVATAYIESRLTVMADRKIIHCGECGQIGEIGKPDTINHHQGGYVPTIGALPGMPLRTYEQPCFVGRFQAALRRARATMDPTMLDPLVILYSVRQQVGRIVRDLADREHSPNVAARLRDVARAFDPPAT